MEYFLQQLINGLTLGSVYGLIAIGYTMVYGIIGMINFAHGDIFMVGAFVALISFILFALTAISLPIVLLLTLLIAMVFTACYGWTVEKLAYKPLRKSFRLAPLISALGMSIVLQNYVQAAQGARIKTLQPVIQGGFNFFKDSVRVMILTADSNVLLNCFISFVFSAMQTPLSSISEEYLSIDLACCSVLLRRVHATGTINNKIIKRVLLQITYALKVILLLTFKIFCQLLKTSFNFFQIRINFFQNFS